MKWSAGNPAGAFFNPKVGRVQILLSLLAVAAVVFLAWQLVRHFGSDRLSDFNDRRRPLSRMVTTGEFVDGSRRLAVALAVTKSTLFYENRDMAASVDLQWIKEIDYDTELSTGAPIDGRDVLRLRSSSQTFEFLLAKDTVQRWHLVLPPRRAKEAV